MTIGPDFDGVLTAAQAGEEWAFSLLYRDLNPSVLRYLGAQAPGAAEDLASDTWPLSQDTWDRSLEVREHSEDGSSPSPGIGLSSTGETSVADLS